jgi:hypothetical protein
MLWLEGLEDRLAPAVASFSVTAGGSNWFNGDIHLTNNTSTPINNWALSFNLGGTVSAFWNCTITSTAANQFTAVAASGGSTTIAPGGSVDVDFTCLGNPTLTPTNYAVNGVPLSGTQPTLSIGNTSVTENGASTTADFTVALSPASTQTVTVAYATADGTATAGVAYTATSGTLTFTPGQTTQTIAVGVIGNPDPAPDETFTVHLTNPSGATLTQTSATGTIIDSDSPSPSAGVNVTTFHDDTASTGLNPDETQLTPADVQVGSFGKLYTVPVDGQVYAEPLVDTGVAIAGGPNTAAGVAGGTHDVVFVATENDTLYAIDSGVAGGLVLWERSFTDIASGYSGATPGTNINNPLGATTVSTVSSADVSSQDISPEIGITGTPVIDPANNILYVVVQTKEIVGGDTYFVQRLHAVSLANGTDVAAPYQIGATTNGNTNTTSVYVFGTGDGAVTDPYQGTGKQVVQFNALRESQRAALSLVNNTVYVEWASHGDNGPYHGWVVTWNVANVTTSGFQLSGVLNTSPNDGESGVWSAGSAVVFEPDDSAFYFATGNGTGGPPVINSAGFPSNANYNEALVKAEMDPTTSPTNQGPNGWGIKIVDWFIPYNVAALDAADSDFGSGAPTLLPASAGIPGHPNLIIVAGKEGKIYLLDRDDLGHFNANDDDALDSVPDGSGQNTPPVLISGALSSAAYYDGTIYWVSGYEGSAYAYQINSNGTLSISSQTTATMGYEPGSVVVSSNGTNNGIVWVMDRNANEIHAYSTATLNTELWNSSQKVGGGDDPGALVKFGTPTVANGEVYVGTTDSLVVYGLTPPADAAPQAPALSATTLSGSSVNLTWADGTAAPNTATGYSIQESTDGVYFTTVTTAPAGATSLAVGGLQPLTNYYFRVYGFNSLGNSPYSDVVNATTNNQQTAVNFSGGFTGAAGALTLNGPAALDGGVLQLTNGGTNEAASAFTTAPVGVAGFSTQFTFQLSAGAATADGFTFTLQGVGPTALGASGGGLGYGTDGVHPGAAIGRSVAVKFDLYGNSGEGPDSTGLYTGGASPTNAGSTDLTGTGVDLHSGDVFQVNMTYDGTTLAVTTLDTRTGRSATQDYAVDIPGAVGGGTAYVGFTAGTGGLTATQDILSWAFSPAAGGASPNAPSGLGAAPASATSVALSWAGNAANETGYHLDRATDPGFTQDLLTQTLPASATSFTDTATGLAPGGTYYYRLRAFNAVGDSGNSNVGSVFIPLAPPKPTDQEVTDVTPTEIDMTWQDNAGNLAQGYHVLEAVNHGSFTQVAALPPTSRPAPSDYSWSATDLTPGAFYEFHIIAYNVSGYNDFAGVNATTITLPPGGLTATAGAGVVNLSWAAPTGAASYNIYRGTSPGQEDGDPIATGVTTTTYADATVSTGETYYYTVTAVNANAAPLPSESAPSNEASAIPPDAVPNAPTLSASTLSATSINLTWADGTAAPNTATGYSIQESTDGVHFTTVAAAPAGATSLAVGGLQPSTRYYFSVEGSDALGSSPSSNVVNAATNQAALINFSGGFTGAAGALTLNGPAALDGGVLQLTNGGTNEASSAFTNAPVGVAGFSTQFTFQLSAGAATADGFTFTLQGVGPTAVGASGGGLGYGTDGVHPGAAIGRSVAVKFDLYGNSGEGPDSTGLYTGGASPTNAGSTDLTGTGVDLHSGDVFQVNMTYDGTTLAVTTLDTRTGRSATQDYAVDIPGAVGGGTAYVGFTAGTGGLTATQDILSWAFSPAAGGASPNAPSGLGAAPASATSVALSWAGNAANETGYHLDRATDPGFTQDLLTQTLPASATSFTDTATGLAPGGTYYYRLRAFNAVGDSGNSNVSSVTLPLAPLPQVSIANTTVTEPGTSTTARFTVTLSQAATQTVTVSYATADGTAKAGVDYTATSGTLTFAPGQTSQTITVPVLNDPALTSSQTFTVVLSSPSGATITQGTGTGTITPAPHTSSATVSTAVTANWGSGFNMNVTITNTGTQPITNWTLAFDAPFTITDLWSGTFTQQGSLYTVQPVSYDLTIAPGASVTFGFTAAGSDLDSPSNFTLNGLPL